MRNEPWQQVLDMQRESLKWFKGEFGKKWVQTYIEESLKSVPNTEEVVDPIYYSFVEMLNRGDTMFITEDMMHIILQAAHDLPDDAVIQRHNLLSPRGLCMFETPIEGTDKNGRKTVFSGMGWAEEVMEVRKYADVNDPGQMKIGIMLYGLDTSGSDDETTVQVVELLKEYGLVPPPIQLAHYYPLFYDNPDLPRFEEDQPGQQIVKALVKVFMCMNFIAQQNLTETIQQRAPRACRRRWNEPNAVVTLITLRRKTLKPDPNHKPAPVEWSRRWIVRGHWTRQWYPKAKKHKYIYIHDYVKGPEDKPLVITERRIFNFVR